MPLAYTLAQVRAWFGCSSGRGLDDRILDIATAHDVPLGEPPEIDVRRQRRLFRMNLQLPDSLTLFNSRHLKQHMRSDAALKCRVKVRGQICGKDHDAVERLQFAQQNINGQVDLAVMCNGCAG